MGCLVAVAVVLGILSGWSCAQAPGDAQSFCTETLPSNGVNILNYPPEVKPLMDSRHYQQLLPPNMGAVWQEVDNDNRSVPGLRTIVSWIKPYCSFGGFSVGFCINETCYQIWDRKITCHHFKLNAPVVIRAKVKKCKQTLLFIAMHYWGCTSLEVKGWCGLLLPLCFLITAVQQPGTFSPPSRLKRSSEGVIWMCNPHRPSISNGISSVVHGYNRNVCSYFFTFALMTTGAFSWNVSKLFFNLKVGNR